MANVSQANVVFGKVVRQLRAERGISSQEELASRSGMHRTYIGGIERGECNLCLINLRRLAAGLGMRASELLARVEEQEQ